MRKLLLLATTAAVLAAGAVAVRAQSPGVNSPFQPVWSIPLDSIKRTYSVSANALSAGTGTLTDIWQICGDTSVVTRVTNIRFSVRGTVAGPIDVQIVKRNGRDIGSSISLPLPFLGLSIVGVPYDTRQAPGKATVTAFTGNPTTLGTLAGILAEAQSYVTTAASFAPADLSFNFGNRPAGAPVLLSPTQCLAINLSPASVSGGLFDVTAEWTEE